MADQAGQNQAPAPAPTQQPAVLAGSRVVLLVSKGPPPTPTPPYVGVPDVTSKSQGDALNDVQSAGLTARVFDEPHEKVPHGHVIAQTPQAGQAVVAEAEVVLLVSSGPPHQQTGYVPLPNVVGDPESDAVAQIHSAGLSPQTVHDFSPTVPSGVVIDQIPNAASVAAHVKKSLIWLWILLAVIAVAAVAAGAFMWMNRTTAVPNVVQLTQQDAQAAIVAAGLEVGTVTTTQTVAASEVGKVVSQSPTGGVQAKVRSAVDIVISGGQALVTVPNVVGLAQADAETALGQANLAAKVGTGNSPTVPSGQVMAQAPPADQKVPVGTSIGITISQGPAGVAVPPVVEMTQSDATTALKNAGFKVKVVTNYNSAPDGDVYAQTPAEGTLVAPGTTVTIHVSNGPSPTPANVQVPNVIGQSQSHATSTLQDLGFKVSVSQIASGTAGQVVGQAPAEGMMEPLGATISILVSTGSGP